MAGEKLIRIMQKAGATPESKLAAIVMGEVISLNPVKIKLDKLELSETFLILSPFCYDKYIGEQVIWEGIKLKDRVQMLRVGDGQTYYVLQKEG